jgi:hypothetical protein
VHAAVPEQSPVQPVNVEPDAGVAVNLTEVPAAKLAEQVAPQSIPAGVDFTVPAPLPAFVTESLGGCCCCCAKVAVAEWSALIVSVHVPVPEQSPLHPEKVEPASAVAVNVTVLPDAKLAEQLAPQLTPAGLDVTVPVPLPAFATVTEWELEPEALYAASASTSPQPKWLLGTAVLPPQPVPPPATDGFALASSTCFVAAMFLTRSGRADHNSATTPTTCGPAIDVPLNDA